MAGIPRDTFCIQAWENLHVVADGRVKMCCFARDVIRERGIPVSVHTHSAEQICNGDQMRQIRRDMVNGKAIESCRECYQLEDACGHSPRIDANDAWAHGWANPGLKDLTSIRADGPIAQFRVAAQPAQMIIDVGDECNLKCRICSTVLSTRVAADPVHSRWSDKAPGLLPPGPPYAERPHGRLRLESLLGDTSRLGALTLAGGEPMLHRQAGDLLEALVEAGAAPHIDLCVSTNGSVPDCKWLELTSHFKSLSIQVSIDGHGELNHYLRYPAAWRAITGNLAAFRRPPINAAVHVAVAIQAYNILALVPLLEYLESQNLSFYLNILHRPKHLSVLALPPAVRHLAAERLNRYSERCNPGDKVKLRRLAEWFIHAAAAFEIEDLHDFMVFTNDLDATRPVRLFDVAPELIAQIESAGFPWLSRTRYAATG
jgi:sulfatase maturation enzyme AslB (radical SAM superfamily)